MTPGKNSKTHFRSSSKTRSCLRAALEVSSTGGAKRQIESKLKFQIPLPKKLIFSPQKNFSGFSERGGSSQIGRRRRAAATQPGDERLKANAGTKPGSCWFWVRTRRNSRCSPALPGLLVLRSLPRPGVLEVLESLLADTRYITPPMQR